MGHGGPGEAGGRRSRSHLGTRGAPRSRFSQWSRAFSGSRVATGEDAAREERYGACGFAPERVPIYEPGFSSLHHDDQRRESPGLRPATTFTCRKEPKRASPGRAGQSQAESPARGRDPIRASGSEGPGGRLTPLTPGLRFLSDLRRDGESQPGAGRRGGREEQARGARLKMTPRQLQNASPARQQPGRLPGPLRPGDAARLEFPQRMRSRESVMISGETDAETCHVLPRRLSPWAIRSPVPRDVHRLDVPCPWRPVPTEPWAS